MPLTLAAMLALFNDNTSGDISAADGRDVISSLWRIADPALVRGEDADDVNWDGNDVAAGTTLTVTGSQTITEGDGMVSVNYTGQSANDLNAVIFARTISVGDKWRVPTRLLASNADTNFSMIGVVFADGTASTSAISGGMFYIQAAADHMEPIDGTFGSVVLPQSITFTPYLQGFGPWVWFEIEYVSSNTFRTRLSLDGLSFLDMGTTEATTLTPTHVAIVWSKWGTAGTAIATFGPLTKH